MGGPSQTLTSESSPLVTKIKIEGDWLGGMYPTLNVELCSDLYLNADLEMTNIDVVGAGRLLLQNHTLVVSGMTCGFSVPVVGDVSESAVSKIINVTDLDYGVVFNQIVVAYLEDSTRIYVENSA